MCRAEDLIGFLRARPFEPFRIHRSDGAAFEIRHPELALVEQNKTIVGVPGARGPERPLERTVVCALVHITRIERVDGTAGPA